MKFEKPAILPYALRHGTPQRIPTLVIVGPVEEECDAGSLFTQFPWQLCRMRECSEFAMYATQMRARVVVCERDLPDGDWKNVLQEALRLEEPPALIVTSRLADDRLWAEVLNLGGYDVLAKPLDQHEVRRAVTLAWEHAAARENRNRKVPRVEAQAEIRPGGRSICSPA